MPDMLAEQILTGGSSSAKYVAKRLASKLRAQRFSMLRNIGIFSTRWSRSPTYARTGSSVQSILIRASQFPRAALIHFSRFMIELLYEETFRALLFPCRPGALQLL